MKRLRSCMALLCVILIMMLLLAVPVSANSAQSQWIGTTSTGAIVTDGNCPIIVENELLTFDIKEFPLQYYSEVDDFLDYSGKVMAEYSFYNPADYTVDATLVFPFGNVPDYGYIYDRETGEYIWNANTDNYEVTVNGEPVSKEIRHTFVLFDSKFELKKDMAKLHEGYMEDPFYTPELPVIKYTFLASNVDVETYDAATAAFILSADPMETKVFMENQSGGSDVENGVRLDTWVDLDEPFSVYIIGKSLKQLPEWKFYSNGACTDEISGKMNLISTETITFKDFALSKYDRNSGVLDYDWYNAVVSSLNYFEWSYGAIHSAEVDLDVSQRLMRWYQYNITMEPGERIVNTVTAPIYPSLDIGYEPPIFEYTYLLSPAQTWTTFGNLDIIINTPYYMIQSGLDGFERINSGYELHFTGLPEGELTFTLCSAENPSAPSYDKPLNGGIIVGITLVAVIFIMAVIMVKRKTRLRG